MAAFRGPGCGLALRRLCAVLLVVGAAAACGKKGPPLAPFPRVPAAVSGLAAERVADEAYLTIPVPSKNADGHEPADLERLEVFAITALAPPETDAHRKLATLVATIPVRPVLPAPADTPEALAAAHALLPGFDQGKPAAFKEGLTPELRVPVELPKPKGLPVRPIEDVDETPFGPLVAPPPVEAGRRYYFVVGVSRRGRRGKPSSVASVPFGDTSGPPSAPEVTYTAKELALKWEPPPDAKIATLAPVRAPRRPPRPAGGPSPSSPAGATAAQTPGAPATQAPTTGATPPEPATPPGQTAAGAKPAVPVVPIPPPPLSARSLGFTTQGTTYHVYELVAAQTGEAPAQTQPKALTPQPVVDPELTFNTVVFGVERCFMVRAVDRVAGVNVQGPASPQTCVTPADTFPPLAPQSLAAIGGQGVINLIWEPNSEPDLAGYIVLRGAAPDGTLQPLMPAPIQETTFADRTAQPGVRYVYAVVAVDKAPAPNMSAQSNHVEEATRQ